MKLRHDVVHHAVDALTKFRDFIFGVLYSSRCSSRVVVVFSRIKYKFNREGLRPLSPELA